MVKRRFFLIMEKDLEKRFTFFQEHTQMPSYCLNLQTSLKLSKIETIFSRFTYKKKLETEYQKMKASLKEIDELFISNPEGFIAKNIIDYIKRDFPKLRIISLQHGIFYLNKDSSFKTQLKTFLNVISKAFLGYKIVGEGFGPKSTDVYIVYNHLYKDYLESLGWKNSEVVVSSYLLKGEKNGINFKKSGNGTAVFFLQCLSKLGILNHEDEMEFVMNIATKLSRKFKKVIIKQHPYAPIDLPKLPGNCVETIEKVEMDDVDLVTSAFSTALLDYEKYDLDSVAIRYNKLNINFNIYDQFLNIHEFENDMNKDFEFNKNKKRETLPIFFEMGETSLESI